MPAPVITGTSRPAARSCAAVARAAAAGPSATAARRSSVVRTCPG